MISSDGAVSSRPARPADTDGSSRSASSATSRRTRTIKRDSSMSPSVRSATRSLTVFADAELPKGVSASDAPWSVGAMLDRRPGPSAHGPLLRRRKLFLPVGYSLDFLGILRESSVRLEGRADAATSGRRGWAIRSATSSRSILRQGQGVRRDEPQGRDDVPEVQILRRSPHALGRSRRSRTREERPQGKRRRAQPLGRRYVARDGVGDPREARRPSGFGQTRRDLRRQHRDDRIPPRERRRQSGSRSRGARDAPRLFDRPHVRQESAREARHRVRGVAFLQVQVRGRDVLEGEHVGRGPRTAARHHRGRIRDGARGDLALAQEGARRHSTAG